MLTVVTWKWGQRYTLQHVERMQAALKRCLHVKHRFVCISDDERVPGYVPLPPRLDGCVREAIRLWMFSSEASALFPGRILNLDIDMVLTNVINPLVSRVDPFVIWRSESFGTHGYALNPSFILFDSGVLVDLWDQYAANPMRMWSTARKAGFTGTEQAVLGHWYMNQDIPTLGERDGIYSFRMLANRHLLPSDARIVSFHDRYDPARLAHAIPWVKEHWQ